MIKNESTHIMNLEGSFIYKAYYKNEEFTVEHLDKKKLFTATMPYSLENLRVNDDEFYLEDDKQYTKLFVNVNFKKHYTVYEDDKRIVVANKSKIRKHLYLHGFDIGGVHYCFHKRGASKAKNGSDIFIKADVHEYLINRGRLGIKFEQDEPIDLTSVYAYECLVMSAMDFTINLRSDEILIIDDINGKKFSSKASVTEQIGDELETETRSIELQNCLTDGQGLLDESVFVEYKKSNKGFMLLRSDWFKCCAFNTKLRAYWKENKVTEITEKIKGKPTGRVLKCDKVKLVITPNSLKFLKLAYKFNGDVIKCYRHWLDNIDSIFGVVKTDKQGNFGTANRTTYQLLNSLPLSKVEIYELAKPEIDYVMALKNDLTVFKNYIGSGIVESLKLEDDMDYSLILDDESVQVIEEEYKTRDMMINLSLVDSDFVYTDKFKDYRKEQIKYYVDNLRHGKLRLKDTLYCTLFSNPYSMLQATLEQYVEGKCTQKGREVWCKYYSENQEFCGSRNPHVLSGNVMHLTNKYHDEYSWFNLTDNIVIINANDNDILDRAQGCDVDSDTFLLLPLLAQKAELCEKYYPTPINRVKGENKPKKNNMKELAKLDQQLSNNLIGKIINKSQIINSYIWDAIENEAEQGLIDELYKAGSKLSSLSQIEIDKSKKTFDNLSIDKELRKINKIQYKGKPIIEFEVIPTGEFKKKNPEEEILIKKMIVPNFFNYVAKNNSHRSFREGGFKCPMDYLQELLDEHIHKPKRLPVVKFKDLLVSQKSLGGSVSNTKQLSDIYEIIRKCGKTLNGLNVDTCQLNDVAKATIRSNAKKEAIDKLKILKISNKTILSILRQAFKVTNDKIGFSKYAMVTLNLLYWSHTFATLDCFYRKCDKEEVLIEDKSGDIDIFGLIYTKVTRGQFEKIK